MGIGLDQVARAARERAAAITSEAAGYLILLTIDHLAVMGAAAQLNQIRLESDGSVRVVGASPVAEPEAVRQSRAVLAQLLSVARIRSPALDRLAHHSAAETYDELRDGLAAALVPLNPAAAQRGLARLWREVNRAAEAWTAREAAARRRAARPSPAGPAPERRAIDGVLEPASPAPAGGEPATSGANEARAADGNGAEQLPLFPEVERPESSGRLLGPGPESAAGGPLVRVDPLGAGPVAPRSDLDDLLHGFLSETRSDEHLAQGLRRAIGVEGPRDDEAASEPVS